MLYPWRFFRAGGFDQVKLSTGADLMALEQLDQKLWVALACPTKGLHFDSETLDYIDTDNDGRIRAPELIAAVKWAGGLLKDPDQLIKGEPALWLDAINDALPEGKAVKEAAQMILREKGKADARIITLEDAAEAAQLLMQLRFHGDGIITEDLTDDPFLKPVIKEIIGCLGSELNGYGVPGIGQSKIDQFFADAAAFVDWSRKAEQDPSILPLGEATGPAAEAVKAISAKVSDYFTRCQLVAFDSRAQAALNREEKEYLAIAAKELTLSSVEIAALPLAHVEANRPLPLVENVNPAWRASIATLFNLAVRPLLGDKRSLSESDWLQLLAQFAPFECWQRTKAGGSVERLGLARVRVILISDAKEKLAALIEMDRAAARKRTAIRSVHKLIHFHRDLYALCLNFVNFEQFYNRPGMAIFQAGTLYLDQRRCELVLSVEDPAKHATMAALAGTYLAYCNCVRKGSGEQIQIVAAVTDGDSDNLMVGRNGIFYDRNGSDWDATVIKIIDNPISIRQAFWAPYRMLVRMVEEQVAKRAATADADSTAKLQATAATTANVDKVKAVDAKKIDVGTVAALGVAFGALATALAAIAGYISGLFKLPFWQVCLALGGLLLLVSGPTMLIAWLKLRKRNLGPILDSNGWALNARARLNVPFGGALTQVSALPAGSVIMTGDKFAEIPSAWPRILGIIIAAAFFYSLLNSRGLIYAWSEGRLGEPTQELAKLNAAGAKLLNESSDNRTSGRAEPANARPDE